MLTTILEDTVMVATVLLVTAVCRVSAVARARVGGGRGVTGALVWSLVAARVAIVTWPVCGGRAVTAARGLVVASRQRGLLPVRRRRGAPVCLLLALLLLPVGACVLIALLSVVGA